MYIDFFLQFSNASSRCSWNGNSVGPDQTAPVGADGSGSAQLVSYLSVPILRIFR